MEREKKKLEESLKKLELKKDTRRYGKRSDKMEVFTPLFLPFSRGKYKRGRFDCGYTGYVFSLL